MINCALAGAHAGFGRLGCDRLIRKDPDPDLATALDMVRDRAASRLDLARGHPCRFQRHQDIVAEGDRVAALGHSFCATALLLAVLDALGHQHNRRSF